MAMTLLEAAKLNSGEVLRSAIIELFAENSSVLAAMPFIDIGGGAYTYNSEGQLPGVAFRGVNESYAEGVGVINPATERLRIAGGDLDVDKAIIRMNGASVRSQHESMKVKALSMFLSKTFIKGDGEVEVREFDGLQKRLTGPQLVDVLDATPTDGGDPLSIGKLDELIDTVDNPTHLVMSKALRRRMTAAARDTTIGGFISYAQDDFGRTQTLYNDLPILILEQDETGARILDFNEVGAGGSTATATSVYCVNFSEEGVSGIQNGVMDVTDLGEIDTAPVLRTRVEWLVSMVVLSSRGAARLRGISNAAAIA